MIVDQKSANRFITLFQKIIKYLVVFLILFAALTITINIFSRAQTKYSDLGSKSVAGWKEYKNEYMGISLKYPTDWELNALGESGKFEEIILESPCNIQSDTQCATVSIYPRKEGVDAVPYYNPDKKSNEVSLNVDGVVVNGFDFDYSPINSLEKIYQFEHNNINYDVTYFETPYKNGEPGDPESLVYSKQVEQMINSISFSK